MRRIRRRSSVITLPWKGACAANRSSRWVGFVGGGAGQGGVFIGVDHGEEFLAATGGDVGDAA
jgi:hypothetical protein